MEYCTRCNKKIHDGRIQCAACRVVLSRRRKIYRLKNERGGSCMRCGYDKCLDALEFHHPGQKEFHISKHMNRAFATLKEETLKCELVCANCHREIHAGQKFDAP